MKRVTVVSVILLFVCVLFALSTFSYGSKQYMYNGSNIGNQIYASYKLFTGTKTKVIKVEEGNLIVFHYSSKVNKGDLSLKLVNPDENIIGELETNITANKEVKAEKSGDYVLIITGTVTEGSFNVEWDIITK